MNSIKPHCPSCTCFNKDVSIVQTSIDRPEIAYIRKVIPTNQKRQFRYLYFLVEDAAEEAKPSPLTIPKSLLFFESRDIMHKCVITIRNWLMTKYGYSSEQALKTVVAYHEYVAQYDKTLLYAEFKKEDSRLRIVCGTDAILTDLDVPDISRVIQVGMERDCDVNILLQRLGRGGRKGQQALGIFFIEAQWIQERSEPETIETKNDHVGSRSRSERLSARGVSVSTDNSAESNSTSKRERQLPDVLYEFCHTETRCLWTILLDHHKEPSHVRGGRDPRWCCSICNPELAVLAELPLPPKKPELDQNQVAMVLLMEGWCTQLAKEELRNSIFSPDYRIIISNGDLEEICRKAWILSSTEEMKRSMLDWELGGWHSSVLESIWGALLIAREAVHHATSTRVIKERLQDWPWQFVDVSELKTVLKENESGEPESQHSDADDT